MTYAQKILLASALLLYRIREAGIAIDEAELREFNARIERWCLTAQLMEGVA